MASDVHQIIIVGSVAGEFVENILHFQGSVDGSATPAADSLSLITQFRAMVEPSWLPVVPDDYVVAGYKAKRVNNTGGPTVVAPVAGVNGEVGAIAIASGVGPCLIGNYYASGAIKPRWKVSRIFIPGVAVGLMSENVFTAPYPVNLAALAAALGAAIGGAQNWRYGVFHKATVAPAPVTAENFYIPVNIQLSGKPGTQRRRYSPTL